MKFPALSSRSVMANALLLLSSSLLGRAAGSGDAVPLQTYFVPLPEGDITSSFQAINPSDSSILNSDIQSLTSVTVAVSGVVIWYDHWEDGYEADVTSPTQSTTLIWGDGDMSNGCVQDIRDLMDPNNVNVGPCTDDSQDLIVGGEAFILENLVALPRNAANIFYDGGDVVKASFPIAITKGAYPGATGPYLSGAVEVFESKTFGTDFIVPVGTDTHSVTSDAFEMTEVHLMASEDGTVVTYNGAAQGTINTGQTMVLKDVTEGSTISTGDKPATANLITGDKETTYEMRWYSLLPTSEWYNDYYTPVHDTSSSTEADDTAVYLYNPNDVSIQVKHMINTGELRTLTLDPNDGRRSWLPNYDSGATDSGSRFFSVGGESFFAMTVTDMGGNGNHGNSAHDWGHPLVPANKLTSQAIIGLGYGCVKNSCIDNSNTTRSERNVVWLTAEANADIYIDFDGAGPETAVKKYTINALDAERITDDVENDKDMTGAVIWATAVNDATTSVKIAVAWGQEPQLASNAEEINMDMGTVVPPLPELSATKIVQLNEDRDNDGKVSVGDVLLYTIRVVNTGQLDLVANSFDIIDDDAPLFDQTDYVPGSTDYTYTWFTDEPDRNVQAQNTVPVDDEVVDGVSANTTFPLDEGGILNNQTLFIGTAHQITFKVTVKSIADITSDVIINTGRLVHNNDGSIDEFSTRTPLVFNPSIDIDTTVTGGNVDASRCPGDETWQDLVGSDVTYCYTITNTGDTYLTITNFQDSIDSIGVIADVEGTVLAPGESITRVSSDMIDADFTNNGIVEANPIYANGADLAGYDDVNDADPADVVVGVPLAPPPTEEPTNRPSSSPSAAPTGQPVTSAPSPRRIIDIVPYDDCKGFNATYNSTTVLCHFAFVSHAVECMRARVYVSATGPVTDEEAAAGELDSTEWTLMCDSYVFGRGSSNYTFIPSDDCTSYLADGEQYFYLTMEYVDEATFCTDMEVLEHAPHCPDPRSVKKVDTCS